MTGEASPAQIALPICRASCANCGRMEVSTPIIDISDTNNAPLPFIPTKRELPLEIDLCLQGAVYGPKAAPTKSKKKSKKVKIF